MFAEGPSQLLVGLSTKKRTRWGDQRAQLHFQDLKGSNRSNRFGCYLRSLRKLGAGASSCIYVIVIALDMHLKTVKA